MATNELKSRIKHAYKTESEWSSSNPVLLKGEVAYSSDKANKHKVGDGTSTWSQLAYVLPSKSDIGLGNVENKSSATIRGELTKDNVTTALGYTPPTTNTTYAAGTGLSLSGTTFNHSNSVTAGTAQGDSNKTLSFGGTFTIPTVTYDAQGHVTSKGTTTMTMPANPNTDTKVTQTAVTDSSYTNWRSLIWGASNSGTEGFSPTTVTDGVFSCTGLSVQPSTGTIRASIFKGALSGNASTATKLATARTIALTGSVTGSGSFDGSGNLSITTTTNHTHNYAGSSSAGGSATSAVKLDSSAGSATNPVYFSSGKPTACTYTLGKSVPSDAVFTDTHYTSHLYVGASGGNANATSATSDPYLLCVDNTTNRNSIQLKAGSNMSISAVNGVVTFTSSYTNTTYSAGTGISLSGTTFSNSGVRSISTGSTNGTISVNTNGTSAEVAVKGLGGAAYTESSAYATSGHKHNNYVTSINSVASSGLEIGSYDTESVSDVSSIYVQYASGTQAGVVSTSSQTFAGSKTFSNVAYFKNGLLTGERTAYNDGNVGCYVAGSGYIQIQSTGTPALYFFKGTETSSSNYIYSDGSKLGFKSAGTIAVNSGMSLDGGGLVCNGNITVGANIANDSTTRAAKVINGNNNVSISTSTSAGLYHHSDNGASAKWLIYINTSGTVTVNTSDKRWKVDKGILDSQEAKTILKNIDIINFIYKDDVGKNNLEQPGIYAQDLRDILINNNYPNRGYLTLSNFKTEEECCEPSYDISLPEEDNRYDVDYSKFIPILWKGWQGHDTQIDSNTNEIAQLKETINVLLQKIEQLENSNAS